MTKSAACWPTSSTAPGQDMASRRSWCSTRCGSELTPPGSKAMPRVKVGPALPDRHSVEDEIARLRDLDSKVLRARWHIVFGRPPPPALAPHLIYRTLAYRLQADVLGDLNAESVRLLDRSGSPEQA